MGQVFRIFQNLSLKWPKLKEILEKCGDFAPNMTPNMAVWCMNGSLFLENLHGICMGLHVLSNNT